MKVLQISKKDTMRLKKSLGTVSDKVSFERVDEEECDFHLGGFVDGRLVTTASFHLEKNPLINEENQFRLDEIITMPEHQNSEVTKELLKTAFPLMKRNFTNIVWCDLQTRGNQVLKDLDFYPITMSTEEIAVKPTTILVKNL